MSAPFEPAAWLRRLVLLLLLLLMLGAALGAVFLARSLGELASPSTGEAAETALPSA